MKLFEVTKWGHNGNADDADTNYLVSAKDYLEAVDFVEKTYTIKADLVTEMMQVVEMGLTEKSSILRGPYIAFVVNNGGWKCWRRYTDKNGIITEFEEM